MENEIKVGEWVRTDNGIIGKYVKYRGIEDAIETSNKWIGFDIERDIVKHSPNLIDIVKTGDYVNGMEVLDIHKPRDLWEPIEIRVDSKYTNFILAEDIKTILTKEQFKANCYKLGGKDE